MWSWLLGNNNNNNNNSAGNGGGGGLLSRARFGGLLGGRREFTLANMQFLHHQLLRSHELADADIVEVLRVLSEFLIYSDQNRTNGGTATSPPAVEFEASTASAGVFFDYFCEKNILALLVQMGQAAPSVAVQVQLLQTLSILIQNITTQTSLYYLLSNNYVNKLLESPFAYDRDDDVRDWFVTLLKALSLRLNEDTVQFFFDSTSNSFPLYAQALRFGRCSETMIKVAVKTLMLNVLKVQDDRLRRFLLEYQKMAYFADIVEYANEMALKIQGLLNIWTPTATAVNDKLEEAVDAYIDHCFYLQDILDVNLPELCYKVGDLLYSRHIKHFLAVSILPNCNPPPQRISTRLALYLLTRLLGILEHSPLVNAIAFLLLSVDANERSGYSTVALGAGASRKKSSVKTKSSRRKTRKRLTFRAHSAGECNSPVCYLQTRYSHGEWPLDEVKSFELKETNWFRQSLLTILESSDQVLASTALLVIAGVVNNNCIDPSLLREMKLLPLRLHRHHHRAAAHVDTVADSPPILEGDDASRESSDASESSVSTAEVDTSSCDVVAKLAPDWLVDRVLRLLHRCPDLRILDVQLCIHLLLDLVWDKQTTVDADGHRLSATQLDALLSIHSICTHQVMQSMRGAMADVDLFIYVLEDEYAEFHKAAFPPPLPLKSASPYEFLVPLLSPSGDTAEHKSTLALRHPVNEMEVCRKAMRAFLLLRRVRELVDPGATDDGLAQLVAYRHAHTAALAAVTPSRTTNSTKDVVELSGMVFLPCMWREQRFLSSPAKLLLVLNPEALVLVERGDVDHTSGATDGGFVRLFAPIHRVYAALDAKDELVLHLTIASATPVDGCRSYRKAQPKDSALKSWHASVLFAAAEDARQAKANVDLSRAEVRAFKLLQIEHALSQHAQVTSSQRDSVASTADGE